MMATAPGGFAVPRATVALMAASGLPLFPPKPDLPPSGARYGECIGGNYSKRENEWTFIYEQGARVVGKASDPLSKDSKHAIKSTPAALPVHTRKKQRVEQKVDQWMENHSTKPTNFPSTSAIGVDLNLSDDDWGYQASEPGENGDGHDIDVNLLGSDASDAMDAEETKPEDAD